MDVYLTAPRGFCAGVRRAIAMVEDALLKHGAPVYVRHEIVHNKHVIADLEAKGAVFIEELNEAPDNRPVVFSAHGVSLDVFKEAQRRGMMVIDATCPLVEKVHKRIKLFDEAGLEIIVIGKQNHPEIIGTIGQLDKARKVHVIYSIEEAQKLDIPDGATVGFVTQTTLSVDDTKEIIACLKQRFPNIQGLDRADICYATTNRQAAVRELAQATPNIVILGSKNSSNSRHLCESAFKHGAQNAWLIDDYHELDWAEIDKLSSLGISAGASAPEYLVENLLTELKRRYNNINIQQIIMAQENVNFKL